MPVGLLLHRKMRLLVFDLYSCTERTDEQTDGQTINIRSAAY